MGFDVKVWQNTRIGEAEGSGVAKAIVGFDKVWPKNYAALNRDSYADAGKAITAFLEALQTAEGKCDKAKKPDQKKLAATKKLIKEWRSDLAAYDDWLQRSWDKKQIELVAATVVGKFNEIAPNGLQEIAEKIDGLEAALQRRQLTAAYKSQTDASKSLRVMAAQLTPKGVKEQIGYACRDLGVDPKLPNVVDCRPDRFPEWKRALAQLDQRFEALEPQLDQLESGNVEDDPDQASGTPDYKKNLKELIADYKGVTQVCLDCGNVIDELLARCRKLEAIPAQTRAEQKDKFAAAMNKIAEMADAEEAKMKTEVEKIRNKDGEYVKKKDALHITDQDSAKFLAPELNRMFSKNLRTIKRIAALRGVLEELTEG